jgi:hypothetical protein
MHNAIKANTVKQTELIQALFALGAKNIQTVFATNQRIIEAAAASFTKPGSSPDLNAAELFEQANAEITQNANEAKRLISASVTDAKDVLIDLFESGVEAIEKEGHAALASGLRTAAAQVKSAHELASAAGKQISETVASAQASLVKETKGSKAKSAKK